jgi:hypothetical protein
MRDGAGLSRILRTRPLEAAALGVVAAGVLVAGVILDPAQAFAGLLTAGVFGLTLALGAAVFAAIQGVSGARWWAPLRGVTGSVSGTFAIPAACVGVALLLGTPALYAWARPEAAANHLLHAKAVWLNRPLFLARALVILLSWTGLIALLKDRLRAVESGTTDAQPRFARASVGFLLVLGPTISVAFWDWVMSLEPEWFSTMFAVYGFAGTFLGGIATVTAVALFLDARGTLARPLTEAVRHDLGKLLFGFATFWAYIWFCQYLLIWYSNIPEETPYYTLRLQGGWTALFWLNPVVTFLAPFAVLLGSGAKKKPATLGHAALVVILGRWLDTYVMVAPSAGPLPAFPLYAVAASLLVLAGMALLFDRIHLGAQESAGSLPAAVTAPS